MGRELYAATTKPNQEERAERELRRQGFESAVPKVRCVKGDGPGYVLRPYIRGYVLIAMDVDIAWWPSINSTHGVGRLVMSGGVPSRMWGGEGNEFVERVFAGELVADERELDGWLLEAGDAAGMVSGTFAGHSGVVSDIDRGHARIGVMIDILGSRRRIELRVDQVRKQLTFTKEHV